MDVDDTNDEIVEGVVLPPPVFGVDISDTSAGNGSFNKDPDYLAQMRELHVEHLKELKKERVKAFNEGMLKGLEKAAKLHEDILTAGSLIAENAAQGMLLSQQDRELLKLAAASAKEVVDRSIGKSATKHEEHKTVSFLGLMMQARQEIEGEK